MITPSRLLRKSSQVVTFRSLKSSLMTGNAFMYPLYSSCPEMARPSNHLFPLYLMLKKASNIDRFMLFPKRRGRMYR